MKETINQEITRCEYCACELSNTRPDLVDKVQFVALLEAQANVSLPAGGKELGIKEDVKVEPIEVKPVEQTDGIWLSGLKFGIGKFNADGTMQARALPDYIDCHFCSADHFLQWITDRVNEVR